MPLRHLLSLGAMLALLPAAAHAAGVPTGVDLPPALPYAVHEPDTPSDAEPLILLLHGWGASEKALAGLWEHLPPQFLTVSVRAPSPTHGGGYQWFVEREDDERRYTGDEDEITASMAAVQATLQDVLERYPVDRNRIFVAGFSQGAMMVYRLMLADPQTFRGGAAMSGALLPLQLQQLGEDPGAADKLTLFIGHGMEDGVVSFADGEQARDVLKADGAHIAFHAYPGMGHEVGGRELEDLGNWLQKMIGQDEE